MRLLPSKTVEKPSTNYPNQRPRLALIDWMVHELDDPGVCGEVLNRHDTPMSTSCCSHRNDPGRISSRAVRPIAMSIMIILMLTAIPNFISMKAQADDTSAIQSLRGIYQAQIQYQTDFPANGFLLARRRSAATPAPVHRAHRRHRFCSAIERLGRHRATPSMSSSARGLP
jgi:hypothetical protein